MRRLAPSSPSRSGAARARIENGIEEGTTLGTAPQVTRADVGLRSGRGPVLVALMTSTALIAIDATILATAVPTIVGDLGGFTSFPWLFSVYLLTQAVTVPLYAKLSDTIGRKPVMLIGIGVFVLGSVLCGLAWSMPALIAFRAVQGLGAGAVLPMAVTIAGDIYTVAERAKVQGYIASVWGVSAVVGPALGGFFAEYLTWHWIFFTNVPLGLLAAWLVLRHHREKVERRPRRQVDWAGAALLTVAVTLVLVALLEGGGTWGWASPATITALAVGVLLLVALVLVERRAAEPVLPLSLWSRPLLRATALVAVGVGAVLFGVTAYVPTYLESLLGVSPVVSGLTLATLTIGWPIAAANAGRLYLRWGFRATVLLGAGVVAASTAGLALTSGTPSLLSVGLSCFVMGVGLGLVSTPSLVAAQSSVEWAERGVVTGANMFARTMGSAVGVAALGALVAGLMAGADPATDPDRFGVAATAVFTAVAGVAVLLGVAALAMPRGAGVPSPD